MNLLVVGGGGREHALVWSLSRSPLVDRLLCAPGNPGIGELADLRPVPASDVAALVSLATSEGVDLVVVGPEAPLVAGLADALRAEGIRVFGPGAAGARLEGSKGWAKSLMAAGGIPTAAAASFDRLDDAVSYVDRLLGQGGRGVVVKADGLAAGKGVTVCDDRSQATAAITDALERGVFGAAGSSILIEERLAGQELSVLAFCDGKTVLPMEAAQDFKRAHDGDLGPNTGGMGSHSPVPACTTAVAGRVTDEVLEPIAAALAGTGEPYVGVLYAGIMLTDEGPKVLEFNCRFGDPETQALLPRLASDVAEPILACTDGTLGAVRLAWRPEACVAVVAAAAGYPGPPAIGAPIRGLGEAAAVTGIPVFHAGTGAGPGGGVVTAGGRVLAVAALGDDHQAARRRAYDGLAAISFDGKWSRSDIAQAVGLRRG